MYTDKYMQVHLPQKKRDMHSLRRKEYTNIYYLDQSVFINLSLLIDFNNYYFNTRECNLHIVIPMQVQVAVLNIIQNWA